MRLCLCLLSCALCAPPLLPALRLCPACPMRPSAVPCAPSCAPSPALCALPSPAFPSCPLCLCACAVRTCPLPSVPVLSVPLLCLLECLCLCLSHFPVRFCSHQMRTSMLLVILLL